MLMRFDPFRELERLAEQGPAQSRQPTMAMDAYRKGDEFMIHFDLPGVDPESIDLTSEKNVVTVTAERRWPQTDDLEVVVAERPQGRFTRQLFLGEGLDPGAIRANYDNGVLTLTVPVAEQAKPRKVQVTTGGGSSAGPQRVGSIAAAS